MKGLFAGTVKLAFWALLVVLLASCAGLEGDDGTPGASGHSAVWSTTAIEPTEACPNGGVQIDIGLDLDDDGILDEGEITGESKVICNGTDGAGGVDGPTVVSVAPAAGDSDVSVTPDVEIVFSEALDEASLNGAFVVEGGEGGLSVGFAYNSTDFKVTLTFDKQLAPDTSYTVFVLPTVEDLDGNPLRDLFISQFTTGADTVGPGIAAVTPAEGAGISSSYPTFCFKFSELVAPGDDYGWDYYSYQPVFYVYDNAGNSYYYNNYYQEPPENAEFYGIGEICYEIYTWEGPMPSGTTLTANLYLAGLVDAEGNVGTGAVAYTYEVAPVEITGEPILEGTVAQGGKFSMRVPVSDSAAYAYVSITDDSNDWEFYGERREGEDFIRVEGDLPGDFSAGGYYVYDIYVEDDYGWEYDEWWVEVSGDEWYQDENGTTTHPVISFMVEPSPDLSVSILSIVVDEDLNVATVTVEVANYGSAAVAAGVSVALAVDRMTPWFMPTVTGTTGVELAADGGTTQVVFTVDVSGDGSYVFEAAVDPDNLVAEQDDWNNVMETYWPDAV